MSDSMKLDSYHVREDATGHLLCWGCGEFGQHGHGYRKEVGFVDGAVERFCREHENQVKHVGCGASHTAVVTNANDIYVWGNGNSGQLGCNDLNTKMEPQKVALYNQGSTVSNISGIACGGRHTMVWLDNGQVFGFGNNLNSQLGYDFKEKNYKENQATPTLLKGLMDRPVEQVACGDKHTVFRFKDGGIASVGGNTHGQLGTGNRDDAAVPTDIKELRDQPVKFVAAGSQHTLIVTDGGEIFCWGYGRACGSKTDDLLSPVKTPTHRRNVVAVAGGSIHSIALTGNGSLYTWGCGNDGQLGHGENIKFLSTPRRVKDRHVTSRCVHISCGETFSAAVTEKGLLYMWGKNSHTIMPGKPTTHKLYVPYGVNKNFRGGRLTRVYCGSWHAVAFIGRPELLMREEDPSSESDTEMISGQEIQFSDDEDLPDHINDTYDDNENVSITKQLSRQNSLRMGDREKTTVSLADFYAPTPDINKNFRSPSPEHFKSPDEEERNIHTARSGATLIVQLPVQPMTSYADAATSPMTITTTNTSSTKSSSVTTLSRVPSPISELISHRPLKTILKPEKKFKEFDPQKYERERLRNSTTPATSEVVQFSKSPAAAFVLPHEPAGLSRKQVDFTEMEEIRLKGPKSPGRQFKSNKYKPPRTSSPLKFRETSPGQLREGTLSKSRLRHMESVLSWKSDSALMESPLFKGSRQNAFTEYGRKPWDAPGLEDERQYKHHVPRNPPRHYTNNKSRPSPTDVNFGLQISRSKTIIAPLQQEGYDPADRLSQLRRYAAMHNPQVNTNRVAGEKLKPIKARHVSIPTGRADSPMDDIDNLCIGAPVPAHKHPSGSQTWRDRSDFDPPPPRKVAAGIVRMYITNNELLGTVDNPLYSSLSDGRGHAGSLVDDDTLIVQPLLKKKLKLPDDTPTGIELPKIANAPMNNRETATKAKTKIPTGLDNEGLDLPLDDTTTRDEMGLDSRVS